MSHSLLGTDSPLEHLPPSSHPGPHFNEPWPSEPPEASSFNPPRPDSFLTNLCHLSQGLSYLFIAMTKYLKKVSWRSGALLGLRILDGSVCCGRRRGKKFSYMESGQGQEVRQEVSSDNVPVRACPQLGLTSTIFQKHCHQMETKHWK